MVHILVRVLILAAALALTALAQRAHAAVTPLEAARADDAAAYWKGCVATAMQTKTLEAQRSELLAHHKEVARDCRRVPQAQRGQHCREILEK